MYKRQPQSNGFADATNKVNILEDNPIIFFSQKKRPLEADISDNLKNAEEFFFMARTGVNFLGSHKSVSYTHLQILLPFGSKSALVAV